MSLNIGFNPQHKTTQAGKIGFGFTVKNQALWQEIIDKNSKDSFGRELISVGTKWADLMEEKINGGQKLSKIAESSLDEIEKKKRTSLSGAASTTIVNWLSQVWTHGNKLQSWHNKQQLGFFEGTFANIFKKGTADISVL